MSPILKAADFEGALVFCVVSNKNQLGFFEKLGFLVVQEITSDKKPTFFALIRKPINPQHKHEVGSVLASSTTHITDVKIVKSIGQGHFSNVYKGLWMEATPVALKTIADEKDFEKEEELLR